MKFTIHPDEREDLLSITIEGNFDFNKAQSKAAELINLGFKSGKKRIFIDVFNIRGEVATSQRYDLAEGISKLYHIGMAKNKFGLKIAVCGNEPVISKDRIEQTFIDNRAVHLKFFTAKQEALEWLLNCN